MRRTTHTLVTLLLLAAPAAASAQTPRARQEPAPRVLQQHPVPGVQHADHILAYRDELRLSTDQVARIRALRDQLIEANRPLVDQLQAARPQGPQQQLGQLRQQRQRIDQQAQQLRQRMQQQRQLTDEQRQALRAQMQQRQDSMRVRMQQRQDTLRTRMQTMTDEQRQAMRAARQQGARGPGAGLPGGRGPAFGGVRANEATAAAMAEVRENTRRIVEEIDAVLTAEQRTTLRTLRPGRIGR